MCRALTIAALLLFATPSAPAAAPRPDPTCPLRLSLATEAEIAGDAPDLATALGPCRSLPEAGLLHCLAASLHGPAPAAETCARSLADAPPWAAEARVAAGARAWRDGDPVAARKHFQAATTLDPDQPRAWAGLVALAAAKKPAEAREHARSLAAHPGDVRRLRHLNVHDPLRPAVRLLSSAIRRLAPDCAECQGRLGFLHAMAANAHKGEILDERSWRAAAAALRVVVEATPEDEDSRLTLGDTLQLLADHQAAAEVYEAGFRKNPRWAEAAREAGKSYLSLGRPEKALPLLEKAVTLEPAQAAGWQRLGEARRLLGRPDAIDALQRAVAAEANPDARTALGQALLDLGDAAGALEQFDAAARLAPDSPQACFGRVRALRLQGDAAAAAEAEGAYQRALEASQMTYRREADATRRAFALGAVFDQLAAGRTDAAAREAELIAGEDPRFDLLPLARAAIALRRGQDPNPFLDDVIRLCVLAQDRAAVKPETPR